MSSHYDNPSQLLQNTTPPAHRKEKEESRSSACRALPVREGRRLELVLESSVQLVLGYRQHVLGKEPPSYSGTREGFVEVGSVCLPGYSITLDWCDWNHIRSFHKIHAWLRSVFSVQKQKKVYFEICSWIIPISICDNYGVTPKTNLVKNRV